MLSASSLYAAIDLGSNSFHMLVVREVSGSIQTVAKIKRKVRLAAGLDKSNQLSAEAMTRGWQCLKLFSEQLQDIPLDQIRVVATATLRLASNAQQFLETAQKILGCDINVISGEEEARLIYQGVAHTTGVPINDWWSISVAAALNWQPATGPTLRCYLAYQWVASHGWSVFSAIAIWQKKILIRLNKRRVK